MARNKDGKRGQARRTRAPADDPATDAQETRQARDLPTRRGPEGDEARRLLGLQGAQGAGPAPRPWGRGPDQSYDGRAIRIDLAGYGGALWLGWEGGAMAEDPEGYAQRIILAVNAHDAPLEVARLLVDAGRMDARAPAWRRARIAEAMELAPDALALAGGKEGK